MFNTYLQSKDVIDINILDWYSEIESEHSGCVVWTNKKDNVRIYGTPSWDVEGETPFNVVRDDDNDAGDDIAFLRFSPFTPVDVQKQLYLSTVEAIIKSL